MKKLFLGIFIVAAFSSATVASATGLSEAERDELRVIIEKHNETGEGVGWRLLRNDVLHPIQFPDRVLKTKPDTLHENCRKWWGSWQGTWGNGIRNHTATVVRVSTVEGKPNTCVVRVCFGNSPRFDKPFSWTSNGPWFRGVDGRIEGNELYIPKVPYDMGSASVRYKMMADGTVEAYWDGAKPWDKASAELTKAMDGPELSSDIYVEAPLIGSEAMSEGLTAE